MKEKFINLLKKVKEDKKTLIVIIASIVVLIIIIALCCRKNQDNRSQKLRNIGITVTDGNTIYSLNYNNGATDGVYRINGKKKEKISEDYGYYLNKYGKYIYYLDTVDNNIVKMKTNGKDKEIILENIDPEAVTVKDNYIYYFSNAYFYRVKINGQNKKRISSKSIESYQIVDKTIYYSYMDNGKYAIAKMDTDGENMQKLETECGRVFFVDGKTIYFIKENNENSQIKYELYKMNIDGKNMKKIADMDDKLDLSTVNFYKNKIYYTKRNSEGNLAIYRMNLNGKNETRIVEIKGYATKININNNYIYYPDENEEGDLQIYKININGKANKENI